MYVRVAMGHREKREREREKYIALAASLLAVL